MNGNGRQSLGYCPGVLGLVALGWILTGQAARPSRQGQPMDWSHRHVIFSQPSTDAPAAAVMHDPRYWQQFNREHFVKTLNVGQPDLDNGMFANSARSRGDWSENLGSGANAGAGVYPAKYSFSVTTANCGNATRPDTVVFSTGLAGAANQANIVAFDNLLLTRIHSQLCPAAPVIPLVCYRRMVRCYPRVQFPLPTGNVRKQRFLDTWRHSDRMNEVRSIRLKDLTTCSSCLPVGSCTRCPGLAFMEGNMREPSSQDCEKSFARTGIPSANMLAKKRTPANLVQIRLAPAGSATQPSGAIA